MVVFCPLYRIYLLSNVMEEQVELECPCKDHFVHVLVVDNLVVEDVSVDLAVLVFWNVHVVAVLEVWNIWWWHWSCYGDAWDLSTYK